MSKVGRRSRLISQPARVERPLSASISAYDDGSSLRRMRCRPILEQDDSSLLQMGTQEEGTGTTARNIARLGTTRELCADDDTTVVQ
jgi:hypothetical protein